MKRGILFSFSLFISYFLIAQSTQPQIYAMVVGVSQYTDDNIPDLKFAAKDAVAFAEFLKSPQAGAIPAQNISILTNEKATRSNVMREVVQLISRSGPNDLFIFYFSGHGKNGMLENTGYLLTYDTESENEEGTAMSMDEISNKIIHGKAKMKVSYIDACHAGLFKGTNAKGTTADNQEIINAYLSGVANATEGSASFLASTSRQQSLEDEKLGHGVFTYYLIKGLQGEADMEQKNAAGYNDGIITIGEMQTYLTHKIEAATKYKQKPSVDGDFDTDFPLSVLKPSISISKEIAKRPEKQEKSIKPPVQLSPSVELITDKKMSKGLTHANGHCYGLYTFQNRLKEPILLYQAVGYYNYGVNVLIAPGSSGEVQRLCLSTRPNYSDCEGNSLDYTFYFQTVGPTPKYGFFKATVEAGLNKVIILNEQNIYFKAEKPFSGTPDN